MVENQRGNIARIGVAVANEATTLGRFIDRGLEHPEVLFGAAEFKNCFSLYSGTLLLHRDSQ
jgi:hypothetical protein